MLVSAMTMVMANWVIKLLSPSSATLRADLCRQAEGGAFSRTRLKPGQIEHRYHKGGDLSDDGGNGCAPHPHLEDEDEHRVENDVDDRAHDHGEHGIFGTAVGPDHRVDGAEIIMNGSPMPMIKPYSSAKGRRTSVAPNRVRMGSIKIKKHRSQHNADARSPG